MKKQIATLFLLYSAVAHAHQEDVPISTAPELRDWCKAESEAHFVGHGVTPYNWSASYWDDGRVLKVEGKWRVEKRWVTVECRIAKGAQRRYAVMEIREDARGSK